MIPTHPTDKKFIGSDKKVSMRVS